MYYVYVLKSAKDEKLYVGFTENLEKRFDEHSRGLVNSTKTRRPLKLIYYEACNAMKDAVAREKALRQASEELI